MPRQKKKGSDRVDLIVWNPVLRRQEPLVRFLARVKEGRWDQDAVRFGAAARVGAG